MKSVVFFNNKGGVGKTTLACNVVSFLATHWHKRVLLVDLDPQCNATQAILQDKVCENIYLNQTSSQKTIYDLLKPFEEGYPDLAPRINPVLSSANKYRADVIPGHPSLSIIEDRLSEHWNKLQSGDIAGFKVTNWVTQLLSHYQSAYDIIVFDVGPSLGALNRTIILASDYIVAPFGCDIFSILGINNISLWISHWNRDYEASLEVAVRKGRGDTLGNAGVITDTSTRFRLAGYSVQQYVSRKFKEGPRPVRAYENIMRDIPAVIADKLGFITPTGLSPEDLRLADIPYVYSLVPLSQASKTPIHELTSAEGLTGAQYRQVKDYQALMKDLTERLLQNIGLRDTVV